MNIGSFIALMEGLVESLPEASHEALERAAILIETEAKGVLGTDGYGWPALSPATIKTQPGMLLETGELRDSIQHCSDTNEAHIGSDNDKAIYHELGTVKVPARTFLMGAAIHKEAEVVHVLSHDVIFKLFHP